MIFIHFKLLYIILKLIYDKDKKLRRLSVAFMVLVCSLNLWAAPLKETTCNEKGACVEIESITDFAVKKESAFYVTLLDNVESVQDLKIYLWMIMPGGHEHGTTPLKITALEANKFLCEKAFFVMKGKWQIKVEYKNKGQDYKFVQNLILE